LARRTELDTLVKRDRLIEEGPAKKRNEIAADREEDEDDVEMKDESGGASDHVGRPEDGAGWRGTLAYHLDRDKVPDLTVAELAWRTASERE
jgi:hypothetical protein